MSHRAVLTGKGNKESVWVVGQVVWHNSQVYIIFKTQLTAHIRIELYKIEMPFLKELFKPASIVLLTNSHRWPKARLFCCKNAAVCFINLLTSPLNCQTCERGTYFLHVIHIKSILF